MRPEQTVSEMAQETLLRQARTLAWREMENRSWRRWRPSLRLRRACSLKS
jgi:hypothetical protein